MLNRGGANLPPRRQIPGFRANDRPTGSYCLSIDELLTEGLPTNPTGTHKTGPPGPRTTTHCVGLSSRSHYNAPQEWYSGPSFLSNEGDDVRKSIILAIGGLAFLAGCQNQGDKAPGIPVGPKWKGPTYRIAFDTKEAKPSPEGITLPAINFTANPDALEKRATLVVRYDSSGVKTDKLIINQIILAPVDISGAEGTLPADYMEQADKGLAQLTGAYCMKGKVKVTVALARSSLSPQARDAEINAKRLSDWVTTEVVIKKPKKGC